MKKCTLQERTHQRKKRMEKIVDELDSVSVNFLFAEI